MGKVFSLNCNCEVNSFLQSYEFVNIEFFAQEEDVALLKLQSLIEDGKIQEIEKPIIERGNHHNKLQFDSKYTTFDGLSRVNKSVLSLLRKFGLKKIIFGEFHENSSYTKGTIVINEISITKQEDIVKGWLYAETGFKNHVDLYFPPFVGRCLKTCLKVEFNRNNVGRLLDLFR